MLSIIDSVFISFPFIVHDSFLFELVLFETEYVGNIPDLGFSICVTGCQVPEGILTVRSF